MFELLKLIPLPLVILSVVLVILPAIFTALARMRLYSHLVHLEDRVRRLINRESQGRQPRIVEDLKKRFKQASTNLEEVNTAALVDGIYSQEKFSFFGFQLRCNQWDYFSQVLPNLLVSFGLLGTFLGIVINLSSLIQTINQIEDASNIETLIAELQTPLQGMGIAFVTSLIAVACSSLLTVVNLRWNTSLAKEDLISSLEDYLDNILQPTIDGHSRLDKAVNLMVKQQNDFLTKFHKNVTETVKSSLGKVAEQIADGNREANKLAKEVYERFTESSGTISNAASRFESVVAEFQNAVVNDMRPTVEEFRLVAQTFEQSQFPARLSEATEDLTSTQQNFSNSALVLEEAVQVIKDALIGFDNNSQSLENLAGEILALNQTSVEVLELHQSNQESLQEIIPKLDEGANSFESAAQNIERLEQRIALREEGLENIRSQLANLVETMNENAREVNSGIQELGNNLISGVTEGVNSNNSQMRTAIMQLQDLATHLSQDIQNLGDRLTNAITQHMGRNNQQVKAAIVQFSKNIDNFGDLLTNTVADQVGTNNQQVQTLLEQLDNNNRAIRRLLEKIEESARYLSAVKSILDRLEAALQSQVESPNNADENSNSSSQDDRDRRRRNAKAFFGRE